MAILMVMMAPMLKNALTGTALNRGADQVIGLLSTARQTALTRGQTVEVRFYCYKDPQNSKEVAANSSNYHALQAFTIDDAGAATPLSKIQTLPISVIMATNIFNSSQASTLLTNATNSTFSIPRVKTSYSYASFLYYRGGTTSLMNTPSTVWCVTVVNSSELTNATRCPTNYTTIVINPYNGQLTPYRPTL